MGGIFKLIFKLRAQGSSTRVELYAIFVTGGPPRVCSVQYSDVFSFVGHGDVHRQRFPPHDDHFPPHDNPGTVLRHQIPLPLRKDDVKSS